MVLRDQVFLALAECDDVLKRNYSTTSGHASEA